MNCGAELEVGDDALTLSYFWKKLIFPKASITRLTHKSTVWCHDGFVVEHTIPEYTRTIAFFTFFRFDRLATELKNRGYPLSKGPNQLHLF